MPQLELITQSGGHGCQTKTPAHSIVAAFSRLYSMRFINNNLQLLCLVAIVGLICCLIAPDAMASSTAGTMPWESPLKKIQASLTGPVAFFASLVGLAVSLMGLVWGGDLSGLMKTMMVLIMIISVLIAATSFLSLMFGVGAEVAALLPILSVGIA